MNYVRLGEIAKSTKGKKPVLLSEQKTEAHPIPYVDIKAFEKGIINQYTDGKSCAFCDDGDLLMVWDGSRSGYVGKAIKGAIGSTLAKIESEGAIPGYLYYFLQGKFAELNTQQRGTGTPHVDPNILWEFEINLPDKEIQELTVGKLEELFSELDSAEHGLSVVLPLITAYQQAVINQAIGSLLRSNETTALGEVADIVGGVTKGRKLSGKNCLDTPYLRVANVQDGFLDLREVKMIPATTEELGRYRLEVGDILFTEGGDRDKLGRGTIWNGEVKNCIHQNHIFRARVDSSRMLPQYISFVARSSYSKQYFFARGKQTTNLASINLTQLKGLPIPIVSLETQQETIKAIEEKLSQAQYILSILKDLHAQSNNLRQSILQNAFAGKLTNSI